MFSKIIVSLASVVALSISSISPFSSIKKDVIAHEDCQALMIEVERMSVNGSEEDHSAAKENYRLACKK